MKFVVFTVTILALVLANKKEENDEWDWDDIFEELRKILNEHFGAIVGGAIGMALLPGLR